MDQRWRKLGDILINYSTRVQPGERVMIAMIEPETFPLAQAVYEAAVKAGGYPQIQLLSERLRHALFAHGNDDQINWVPEIEQYGMEWADVYIGLRGAHNLYELQDIPADKLAANQSAMGKVSTARWQKTRWTLVRVPNESFAQQAQTSYDQIEQMFFNACFLDWEREATIWDNWAKQLETGEQIRITGNRTDLSFSVKGRKWVPFAGINNMPDGEIATAPINESVNGTIYFEHPGVLSGRLIHGIELTWKEGKLVHASSDTEQDFFQSVISKDEGSSMIGEFAIGTNYGVDRFCNDILIDEKIGGTIHIALGRAYPECGGTNESSIHWDIIKDIRNEGSVTLDGRTILEQGKVNLDQ
jgi:aminopeptidase